MNHQNPNSRHTNRINTIEYDQKNKKSDDVNMSDY